MLYLTSRLCIAVGFAGSGFWGNHGCLHRGDALLLSAETPHQLFQASTPLPLQRILFISWNRSNAIVRSLTVHAIDTGVVTRSAYRWLLTLDKTRH